MRPARTILIMQLSNSRHGNNLYETAVKEYRSTEKNDVKHF